MVVTNTRIMFIGLVLFLGDGTHGAEMAKRPRPCDAYSSLGNFRHPMHVKNKRSGIVIWSWGRTGTGTIYTTLIETARQSGMDIEGICGMKEGIPSSCLKSTHLDRSECLTRFLAAYRLVSSFKRFLSPLIMHNGTIDVITGA
jgi:hypothetical protein